MMTGPEAIIRILKRLAEQDSTIKARPVVPVLMAIREAGHLVDRREKAVSDDRPGAAA
jgi:hypothetical protein